MLSRLSEGFRGAYEADLTVTGLHGALLELKERFNSPYCKETPWENLFTGLVEEREAALRRSGRRDFWRKRRSMPACVNWSGCISSLRRASGTAVGKKRMRLRW